jgi:tetratricopeptide (TPR) repeat protein
MTRIHPTAKQVILSFALGAVLTGCSTTKTVTKPPVSVPAERPAQATTQSRSAVQQFEKNRDLAEYRAAESCWQQQDSGGCVRRLQRLLARSPDNQDARLLMAQVLVAHGRQREAISHLEQIVAAHPDNYRAHYALARLMDSAGQHEVALAHLEKAAKLQPNNEQLAQAYRNARSGLGDRTAVRTNFVSQR